MVDKATLEREQQEVNHQILFKTMPVPRFLVKVCDEGKHYAIDANERALLYLNRRESQVIGKPVEGFMDSENARHFSQSFEVSIKQQVPVTIQALPSFPGGIRVHGFWINPLLDMETGKVKLLDVMAQPDSSDESIMQRERDDAISLLTSIFDASEVGIIVTDHNHRIVRVNDNFVRTFGWTRDDLIGEDFTVLNTPDEMRSAIFNHDNFIKNGGRASGEAKIVRKDGTVSNSLFTSATLELSQKRRFLVTTVMDITLRKRMEMSLRVAKDQADAANTAKSAFLANMSHELRTPLNAILGFSEIMMNGTFGKIANERYVEYMEDIHMSAAHLLEIINDVLDMSKIEAGRVELDEHEIDVTELIESAVRIIDSRAFSSGIEVERLIQEGIPKIKGDPRLIKQILINLLSNSVKFSKANTKIKIRAFLDEDGGATIVVKDGGKGIPEEKIREALEPFGQIRDPKHASENGEKGTGLGLPLAKAMMDLHGGVLHLQSEIGTGTTVTLYFPRQRVIRH